MKRQQYELHMYMYKYILEYAELTTSLISELNQEYAQLSLDHICNALKKFNSDTCI